MRNVKSFYEGTSEETVCRTRGRLPNNLTPDCRGYTMCLMGAGGYAKFDLLCPENSIYSHLENQCTNVTSYQCLSDYNCTQEGNFVDPSSENCTSYIACVKDLRAITTARLITCQSNEVFSPRESMCVNETLYNCNLINEPPKVLEVSVDQFPSISGNFSLKSSAYANTLGSLLTVFFALLIVMK
ncbi:uncharacterized protein LOC123866542 isoform X2 [Maniola jurtina]|uniref:uncharacterized protein LOC123866542 isoform X2 n=1 Tax=Maniola jurtina TaxID=191418 RepID=UPI001E68B4BB|nr:uncharacterized protein LOC123866542 isoform X2 [Maniola jurtina]